MKSGSTETLKPLKESQENIWTTEVPACTYRLQMNKDFPLGAAIKEIPYLAKLGISHCYLSPLLRAQKGSMHGYDIVNHNELNPEIGTLEDLGDFVRELQKHNMGLILDIVPNHMGIGPDNPWWMDVLENGPASVYADYFDIDWAPVKPELFGKVLLPILGDSYGSVLKSGQLKLEFDQAKGGLSLRYFEHQMPLNPVSYPAVLGRRLDVLKENFGTENPDVMEYLSILTAFQHLPNHTEPVGFSDRIREKKTQMRRLAALCQNNASLTAFILTNLSDFEVKDGDLSAIERLHQLLEQQAYRLAFWRVSSDEINYRRFFDVDSLAAIRTEDARVFKEMHELVFKLVHEGKVQGLRIDHPDGLYDPAQYFCQLQSEAAVQRQADYKQGTEFDGDSCVVLVQGHLPIYVVVEKILAPFEHLEQDWTVHGTVGYEFLNALNGLLVETANEQAFTDLYHEFLGYSIDYDALKQECKYLILDTVLASELHVLSHRLNKIAESSWFFRDLTLNSLKSALREVLSNFPVYRTYVRPNKVEKSAKQYIDWAVGLAKRRLPSLNTNVYDFLRQVLTLELVDRAEEYSMLSDPKALEQAVQTFAMKFQQFTGPVMAKSIEDTAFYRYNRFVGLNEVGGEPHKFGASLAGFHHQNQLRQQKHPYEMLSTSTHDTKRSEDVRARLGVLSEIPELWREKVQLWSRMNRSRKTEIDSESAPDQNDEYLLYQTFVGALPLLIAEESLNDFADRLEQYILKAARESKRRTSWINQNKEYETALTNFVRKTLTPSSTNPFADDLISFVTQIAPFGLLNSLVQALLKLTCPGVPDIYQGSEFWDFSLVDPDNRRPVDYQLRADSLAQMQEYLDLLFDSRARTKATLAVSEKMTAFNEELLSNLPSGKIKQYLMSALTRLRLDAPQLFTEGKYIPLEISGLREKHVIAFARKHDADTTIVIAPYMIASTIFHPGAEDTSAHPFNTVRSSEFWQDTALLLPEELQGIEWQNLLTLQSVQNEDAGIPISPLLQSFPVALLRSLS